jgi:hypothetical protein
LGLEWLPEKAPNHAVEDLGRSTERILHGVGMMRDDRQMNARWTIRLGRAIAQA